MVTLLLELFTLGIPLCAPNKWGVTPLLYLSKYLEFDHSDLTGVFKGVIIEGHGSPTPSVGGVGFTHEPLDFLMRAGIA